MTADDASEKRGSIQSAELVDLPPPPTWPGVIISSWTSIGNMFYFLLLLTQIPLTLLLSDLFDCYLTSGGMDDEEVSVTGDEENGEGGEEDAGGLDRTDQLAQNLLKKKNITFW